MLQKAKNFVFEVRAEMQKVTWPTREELVGSTMVVVMTMLIFSSFIGVAGFLLALLLRVLLR